MSNVIKKFGEICRKHRILLRLEDIKIGIVATLIGWSLIGLDNVFFKNSIKDLPYELNFFFQFLSGTLILLIASFFKGKYFLSVKEPNHDSFKTRLLNVKNRKYFLYIRGSIAIIGYVVYSISTNYIKILDNSALFSIDPVIYIFLMLFFMKEKPNILEIIGVVLATLSILFVFFIDAEFVGFLEGLTGISLGIFSSICLAIIILMGSILVQHDPPLKIAFYQCLIGLSFAFFLIIIGLISGKIHFNFHINEIIYSLWSGIFYSLALLFFFNALIYTDPLVIAILGYSLSPFTGFFNWVINNETMTKNDFISFIIITIGGLIAIFGGYKKERKMQTTYYFPLHRLSLLEEMNSLIKKFKEKKINLFRYMSHIHEFNKLLFGFCKRLKNTDINKIEINKENIFFTLLPEKIKMITDGACRSAPFEILNFEKYEPNESEFIFKILEDKEIIFDIGAHIGWYSLNFAKKFPNSQIYSFEPINITYKYFIKNISLNHINNIKAFNFGCSDKQENVLFHYFKGGSALSSMKNLINHQKTIQIQCELKKIDEIIQSLKINNLDFIKIDVEGSELKVIKGAINSLNKYKPIIYIELFELWCNKFEYSADTVVKLLKKFNYECYSLINSKLVIAKNIGMNSEQFNYFFFHKNKHKGIIDKYINNT